MAGSWTKSERREKQFVSYSSVKVKGDVGVRQMILLQIVHGNK